MRIRKYTFIFITFSILCHLEAAKVRPETSHQKRVRIITGTAILGLEYYTGYSLAYKMWWPHGFRKINPLTNLGEMEPFYVDDVIHAIGNATSQEIHYQIMKHYFHIKSPLPSMILTSLSWFSIEALDAMEKRNGWRFSVNDELGNLLGVAFWYYKFNYPQSPVYLRLGIRQWENAVSYFRDLPLLFTDRDTYAKQHNHDKYSILKSELIYVFYEDFYTGIAVSRFAADSEKNVWGVTVGWDVLNTLNQSNSHWWVTPTNFIRKNISVSLSFTVWTDKKVTPI